MPSLRRALRLLASPFLATRRVDQMAALVERRLDQLQRTALQPLIENQRHLDRRLEDALAGQVRLRRLIEGESLDDDDVTRMPFKGPLPATVAPEPESGWVEPDSGLPAGPIERLTACPVCGHAERTSVCRFNKMITMARVPDAAATVSDYALCHGCGAIYAATRPSGARFAWILEHFEESLGRTEMGTRRPGKLALSSYDLDDEMRASLRKLAARGVFVSEHLGLSAKEYLWQLQADRFANSRHVELMGSLIDFTARPPRVLEIRSRLGSISAALRRLYGAETAAIAMMPNQRFLIQEVYGIRADGPLDFDHFREPYGGTYDLVIANHMLTHSLRPAEFLATVRESLAPGGYLYTFNEPMEEEFLVHEKSMFNTLNPFHMQTFNRESYVRALEANGFEIVHVGRDDINLYCLARKADAPVTWTPMDEKERERRVGAYRKAYSLSVALLPEFARPRFADVWEKNLEYLEKRNLVARDARGELRVMRAAR